MKVLMGQHNDHVGQEDEGPSWALDAVKPFYEIGGHIGGYKLVSMLGEGDFGMVCLAEQQHPIRRLAALNKNQFCPPDKGRTS